MKKLMVYMDDDFHDDLKELAHRKKTTMAALVRQALDVTFEEELDAIAGQHGLEEYLRDPAAAVSLDDYLKERGIVLPGRDVESGGTKNAARPSARRASNNSSATRSGR
jgi:hypothetical protein